ncbi:hypothetical protein P5673_004487 [Acropora cervicornis]|uniref:Uncharacterized protein n=1 Tax=Acropora cervicornis TaxID=6130 RepID=A0AAD9R0D9_ACRCE|nr:hypothetical protein P5673_004487 [Acropora cervicornis]
MFHLSSRRWDGSLIANCQSIFLPIGLQAGFTHGSAKSSHSACLRQTFSLKKPAAQVRVVGFLTLELALPLAMTEIRPFRFAKKLRKWQCMTTD